MENKLRILGLAAALLSAVPALAGEDAPSPMIINIADRSSVSLDGQWKYLVDQYGIGYYNYRLIPQPDADSFFADQRFDDDRTKLVEYSFDRGGQMRVPGDWNTQYEKLYYYEGKLWYRTKFEAKPDSDKRYFLYFGAVNHTAIVGLNGKKIVRHEGGFTPFNIEVTGRLKAGENSLVVLVDNSRDGIPTNNCDWWNYGGITRSVKLVEMPRTFIRDYAVLMDKEVVGKPRKNRPASHRIYGYVNLDGSAAAGQQVTVSIPELGLTLQATADENGHATFEAVAAPQLWCPESPKLYDVEITSALDEPSKPKGTRSCSTERKSSCAEYPSTKNPPSLSAASPRGRRTRNCLTMPGNWAATSCAWRIIRIMRRWCGKPRKWACWSGPRFRSIGQSPGPTRAPMPMRGSSWKK